MPTYRNGGVVTLSSLRAQCDEIGDMWIWRGRVNNQGTPRMTYKKRERTVARVAYCLHHGIDIESLGLDVVWAVTECKDINPSNLMRGSSAEMLRWRASRGLAKHSPKAIASITRAARSRDGAKLNPQKAAEIRASTGTLDEIAEQFNVHRSWVSKIKRGEVWCESVSVSSIFSLGARA